MSQGNGTSNGLSWKPNFRPPTEVTKFTIGGQVIEVQALTLWAMDIVKDELLVLGPNLDFIAYARNVVRIIFKLTKLAHPEVDITEEDMIRSCSVVEMRQLAASMNELLGISGFDSGPTQQDQAPEQAAQVSGPGTSTSLSPDSPPTESVAETSTG